LVSVYTQQGNTDKADVLIQRPDQKPACRPECHSMGIASQFYQNANADYAIKIFLQGRKIAA
jgi:hypothetical protein